MIKAIYKDLYSYRCLDAERTLDYSYLGFDKQRKGSALVIKSIGCEKYFAVGAVEGEGVYSDYLYWKQYIHCLL